MKRALIVIDMLHDFIDEHGALYCGLPARQIVPRVAERIRKFHDKAWPVIFTCDHHDPHDAEFQMFPPHAVADSPGAQLIPEMGARADDYRLPKTRFDAFYGTELDRVLEAEGVCEVEVAGVCTSICVLFTVQSLRNRDYPVTVRRDCVADFDAAAHEFALTHMAKVLGAKVL